MAMKMRCRFCGEAIELRPEGWAHVVVTRPATMRFWCGKDENGADRRVVVL